jgi:hypothetical protein
VGRVSPLSADTIATVTLISSAEIYPQQKRIKILEAIGI